jgi:DNA polymerase
MDRYTIDFETYYDSQYGLRKLSYPEYILNPLFQVIGVAVAVNDAPAESFTGSRDATKVWLEQFDWDNGLMVAHNAHFEAAILAWVFDIHPHRMFCTMMASRPYVVPYTNSMSLDNTTKHFDIGVKGAEVKAAIGLRRTDFDEEHMDKYMVYCRQDVDLTNKLYNKYVTEYGMPTDEREGLHLTIRKFSEPQLIGDSDKFKDAYDQHIIDRELIIEASGVAKTKLSSAPQFAKVLRDLGIEPPKKISPRTGKETYAFAKDDLEFQRIMNTSGAAVKTLCKARLAVKSTQLGTRLERFQNISNLTGGYFPAALMYWGAHTGRFSGTDKTNLQNLKRGSVLREGLAAPEGHSVLAADYSQIEARITAAMAEQLDLVSEFENGLDVYSIFAEKLYGYAINKNDHPEERFIGKTCILGLGFGMGPTRLWEDLQSKGKDVTQEFCNDTVQMYRKSYWKIKKLWSTADHVVKMMAEGTPVKFGPCTTDANGTVWLPNGMPIVYNNLNKDPATGDYTYYTGSVPHKLYGAKLVENIVQALARVIMTRAELKLAEFNQLAALSVHDELVFVVPDADVDKLKKGVEAVFKRRPPWMKNVPLDCEINVGKNYAECK